MGWYYGAWRKWWHFNSVVSKDDDAFFGPGPYPHIFNPCVQRNALVWLDGTDEKTTVLVPDESFYHYVVYMGERYINDPSNFRELLINKSKICFFQFTIDCKDRNIKKTYQVAVTDYSKNSLIKEKFLTSYPVDNTIKEYDLEFGSNSYRNLMVTQGQNDHDKWNWTLLRNHIYRFQITSFGDLKDDGVDGMVIATEERTAPDISYN